MNYLQWIGLMCASATAGYALAAYRRTERRHWYWLTWANVSVVAYAVCEHAMKTIAGMG